MNPIVEDIIDLLQDKSNLSSPYRNVFVISLSCFFKMLSSIFLTLVKRNCLADWKRGQWRRKWIVVFISRPQTHIGLKQPWKLCPNLWRRKWLKPKCNLVSNFESYGLFISKTLFATGLTNFKRDNLKTFKESLLWMSRSSLFHSVVEGKKMSEEVTPGFNIGYIIDLTASSRIKLQPVWN